MASVDPSRQIAGLADRTTALVGWTIAWRATSAIATLALGALLIRQLPADEYGRYTFVLSVLVYIALLATFGQDQGLLRYLPEVLARGDRAAANDLLRKSAIAILAVWLLTSGAVWCRARRSTAFSMRTSPTCSHSGRSCCWVALPPGFCRLRWWRSTTCAARRSPRPSPGHSRSPWLSSSCTSVRVSVASWWRVPLGRPAWRLFI